MEKYKIIDPFRGSPNGRDVLDFEKDQIVEAALLGDDLTAVALKEKWIKPLTQKETKALEKDAKEAEAGD